MQSKFMKKILKTINVVGLILSIFLTACNYTINKKTPQLTFNQKPDAHKNYTNIISYDEVRALVFKSSCIKCHGTSGNVNLESYGETIKHLDKIYVTTLIQRTMPKNKILSNESISILQQWFDQGTLEHIPYNQEPKPRTGDSSESTHPVPTLTPTPIPPGQTPLPNPIESPMPSVLPLAPNYDSIVENVFKMSCFDCHSEANAALKAKGLRLTKEILLTSPKELVIPGNPDESGLVIALERTDHDRMPPQKEGYSKESAEVIAVIRKWIENGAKD